MGMVPHVMLANTYSKGVACVRKGDNIRILAKASIPQRVREWYRNHNMPSLFPLLPYNA